MNFSFSRYLNSKPTLTIIAILIIAVLTTILAPRFKSHLHLSSLQSQLTDLNHKILSNSQQRQELDMQIKELRLKQSELSTSSQTLRKQRDALEQSIATQMGLWTGGQASPITTQSWSQAEK